LPGDGGYSVQSDLGLVCLLIWKQIDCCKELAGMMLIMGLRGKVLVVGGYRGGFCEKL